MKKERERQIQGKFDGLGGKNWSYSALKKIDELNELIKRLDVKDNNLNSSNGLCGKKLELFSIKENRRT